MLRAATVMKLRRPECDEQPSKPSSLNSAANQLTTLLALRCEPRYERITGPTGSVSRASRSRARRRSGCIGMRLPPRFFAMASRTLRVPETRPCASRTIGGALDPSERQTLSIRRRA